MKHPGRGHAGAVDTHGMVGRALRTICSVHFTAIFVIDLLSHRCDKRVVDMHFATSNLVMICVHVELYTCVHTDM